MCLLPHLEQSTLPRGRCCSWLGHDIIPITGSTLIDSFTNHIIRGRRFFQGRDAGQTKTTNVHRKGVGQIPGLFPTLTQTPEGHAGVWAEEQQTSWGRGTLYIPHFNLDVGVNNCLWNLCGDQKSCVFDQNDGSTPL